MKRIPLLAAVCLLALFAWTFTGRISSTKKSEPEILWENPSAGHGTASSVNERELSENGASSKLPTTTGQSEPASQNLQQRPVPIADLIPRRTLPVDREFVLNLATGPDDVSFPLPDGRLATGVLEQRFFDPEGNPNGVEGRLSKPSEGRFRFRIQPENDLAGPVTGTIVMAREVISYRVDGAADGKAFLTEYPKGEVVCLMPMAEAADTETPEELPIEHPIDIPIPAYQNGIVPLQSLPGNTAVLYLDFDGQKGPHEGWGNFDAVAPNVTNTQVRAVWVRVAEDFAPFKLNVTTDLKVFLDAPENSRQRCIITPTTTASPGAGGVAFVNSFNSIGDSPCWAFYSTGKSSAEVISHELGHTLGLSHDGRISPDETYYRGHGTDPVGWAPIMGSAYNKNLSQWSKGEYTSANQTQDDLNIIVTRNNNVTYRTDDAGAGHASAALLEIFGNGTVDTEGIIGTNTDVDAFRFSTTGGSVNLTAAPVASGPNLDISFSIHDASGNQIATANPDLLLNATITATLPAGEYTVRVNGVGRGNVLETGYSDYGSLGQYTVTGTINGAVGPARFSLAENPAAGRVVGTPTLRNSHGNSPINWSITAGNTDSPFAISPTTGQITVSDPSVLDFEVLGGNWIKPPTFELTVSAMDSNSPALSETLRVVIQITDVNEAPVVSSAPIFALSRTVYGTKLGQIQVTDPDVFDIPTFSIVGGDEAYKFSVDSAGQIFSQSGWAAMKDTYQITVRVSDSGTPKLTADVVLNITIVQVSDPYNPGKIFRTMYENITGSTVSSLTSAAVFPFSPTRDIELDDFTDVTRGDNYGSTIRTWLIAPRTGSYRFWISGDSSTELHFSPTANAANATRIAYRNSTTSYQNFTASTTQQSATFNLTAGQVCYLEARQKEATGADHVSVAWEIKNSAGNETLVSREVIPKRYLSRHRLPYPPVLVDRVGQVFKNAYPFSTVTRQSSPDGEISTTFTWTIESGNSEGIFGIEPVSGRVFVANAAALAATTASESVLTLSVRDSFPPGQTKTAKYIVKIRAADYKPTEGILQEIWDGVVTKDLSNLFNLDTYRNGNPSRIVKLDSFDTGINQADNYGSRIRVYFIPPKTGSYRFHVSGYDNAELYFSASGEPAERVKIAYVTGGTTYQAFDEQASQTSSELSLVAGKRVYLDAIVKAATGNDHLEVGWTGPDVSEVKILSDDETEPFDSNRAPSMSPTSRALVSNRITSGSLVAGAGGNDSSVDEITYAILSGNEDGKFIISPLTAALILAPNQTLTNGGKFRVKIGGQDRGHGGHFPLKESSTELEIVLHGSVLRGETIVWKDGDHQFESFKSEGTIILAGSAKFEVTNYFDNFWGRLDLINWDGELPANMRNQVGMILTQSSVKTQLSERVGDQYMMTINGYTGHTYQLQSSTDLGGQWVNIGEPVIGTGALFPYVFQRIPFSFPIGDKERRFYRISVGLAP